MPLKLLSPLKLGALSLKNRVVMAPLTRSRASGLDGRTPNELMLEYYTQRATAGLIITEATAVTPMGVGYANTPGIWSENQIMGWQKITKAVHQSGGKIILQLWHVGRVSHPFFLNGELPVSASPLAPEGFVSLIKPKTAFVEPRALETAEIPQIIEAYKRGAENAKLAGFDGVEIHGANGYLLDQFLQDGCNKRKDTYGGTVENKARLLLQVTDAAISVWGADRVGVHLSPRGGVHSISDSNPRQTFSYAASELGKRKIAFICLREFVANDSLAPIIKEMFKGPIVGNENFSIESAEKALQQNQFDAIAFGRSYIANPDLVHRIELSADLNSPKPDTFYSGGSTGYSDYPFLKKD